MKRIKFVRFVISLLLPVLWQSVFAIILGCITILSGMGLIATSMYLISYAALKPSISELQVAIIGVRFFGLIKECIPVFGTDQQSLDQSKHGIRVAGLVL